MQLRFYKLSESDFFDKVIDTFSVFFPKLLSINIYADDGTHNLPIHTEELFSKTVDFLRGVYHANLNVELTMIETDQETNVSLHLTDTFQEYKLGGQFPPKDIFLHLYPLEIITETLYYYAAEACEHPTEMFQPFTEKMELTDQIINDYEYAYQSRYYRKFFKFEETSTYCYTYSYHTFLPENISTEHFLRLMIYSLASQYERFASFRFIKKSDTFDIDLSMLKETKKVFFKSDAFKFKGFLAPVSKEFSFEIV